MAGAHNPKWRKGFYWINFRGTIQVAQLIRNSHEEYWEIAGVEGGFKDGIMILSPRLELEEKM